MKARRPLEDMQIGSIHPIETEQLRLNALSGEFLRLLTEGRIRCAQRLVDYCVSENCSLLGQRHINRRLRMIEVDPQQGPWMYRAIVRNKDNKMVGHISFHHKAPDPDLLEYSNSAAELGYTIEPAFRRRGYARESAVAMMEWAHREHGVQTFILSVSPDNVPSMKMAQSMNFTKIGELQDPVDGLEYTMRAEIESILKTQRLASA